MSSRPLRVLFLDGPGDLLGSFRRWREGRPYAGETAATYSGQFFDMAQRLGLRVHAVAWPATPDHVQDGLFFVEHRPRPWPGARGLWYHVAQALWAFDLMALVLRFRPDVVLLVDTPYPFLFTPLSLLSTRIVVTLHNTLWPAHHRPTRPMARLIGQANGWFFRTRVDAMLALSPECERQVREVAAGPMRGPIVQYRPKFAGPLVTAPCSLPPRPFRVLFASRLERNKGIFDVIAMAARLHARRPGDFHWTLCGGGGAEREVDAAVRESGLSDCVSLRGQLDRTELIKMYEACHAVIVPTTQDFIEGLAKTAFEAVLAGRPAIVSDVVPAAELIGKAAWIAPAGDIEAFIAIIEKLADDTNLYRSTCDAAVEVSRQILDPSSFFEAMLERTLSSLLPMQPPGASSPS